MKASTTSISTRPSRAPSACGARFGSRPSRGPSIALSLSLLLHAALFAAVAKLTLTHPDLPVGDEITPNITFGLVVNQPPVVEPPPAEPLKPPSPSPPEPEPPAPPPVEQPAMPLPVTPLTTSAAVAPQTIPTLPDPAPARPATKPAKSRRLAAPAGVASQGDRSGVPGLIAAVCTYRATPDFPAAAKREGRQGTVLLLVSLDASGRITNVRVVASSGHPSLDAAAESAARRCRFRPAMRGGEPIAGDVRVPYTFRLAR